LVVAPNFGVVCGSHYPGSMRHAGRQSSVFPRSLIARKYASANASSSASRNARRSRLTRFVVPLRHAMLSGCDEPSRQIGDQLGDFRAAVRAVLAGPAQRSAAYSQRRSSLTRMGASLGCGRPCPRRSHVHHEMITARRLLCGW
jgi:hypothetical protein